MTGALKRRVRDVVFDMIRTFCDQDHARQWTRDHAPDQGYIADVTTIWQLAQPWYGDRLDPDYRPHDRQHNQDLLDELGPTGAFWRLP